MLFGIEWLILTSLSHLTIYTSLLHLRHIRMYIYKPFYMVCLAVHLELLLQTSSYASSSYIVQIAWQLLMLQRCMYVARLAPNKLHALANHNHLWACKGLLHLIIEQNSYVHVITKQLAIAASCCLTYVAIDASDSSSSMQAIKRYSLRIFSRSSSPSVHSPT